MSLAATLPVEAAVMLPFIRACRAKSCVYRAPPHIQHQATRASSPSELALRGPCTSGRSKTRPNASSDQGGVGFSGFVSASRGHSERIEPMAFKVGDMV